MDIKLAQKSLRAENTDTKNNRISATFFLDTVERTYYFRSQSRFKHL